VARVIVAGYMVRHPVAGNLFAFFHYVLGLHLLGHEVLYLEASGWPYSCYDPAKREHGGNPSTGLYAVRRLLTSSGIGTTVCYVDQASGDVHGMDWQQLKESLESADLLLNIGGVNWLPEFKSCRRLALIDLDPLFTQLGAFGGQFLEEHQIHFSYGANIGRPGCGIPTLGIDWLPTVPPVVTDLWERTSSPENAALTTVANWSAYGAVTRDEGRYGQKDEQFLELLDLPQHTSQRLELALSGIDANTQARLETAGWVVRDAASISADVSNYQQYIQASRGEFSVAKHAYVATRSGWFSDRSVCYLAAGLPVVLQDTGFRDWLVESPGVLAFTSPDDAAACIEQLNWNYPTRQQAAREIAERVFDYRVALPELLTVAMR
jgi:hypothetical protein